MNHFIVRLPCIVVAFEAFTAFTLFPFGVPRGYTTQNMCAEEPYESTHISSTQTIENTHMMSVYCTPDGQSWKPSCIK